MLRHGLYLFGLCFILIVGIVIDFNHFLHQPLFSNTFTYELKSGAPASELIRNMEMQTTLSHPTYLKAWIYLQDNGRHFQAGEYEFKPGLTPKEWVTQLNEGRVKLHPVILIEGWTVKDLLQSLGNQTTLIHTVFSAADINAAIGSSLSSEGLFFPDTYFFPKNIKDTQVLKRAHTHLIEVLNALWLKRDKAITLKDSYAALIVASMIEKETAVTAEKPLIASVIYNRLAKHMRLQIDATVIYGLGDNYSGKLTKSDLKKPSPYNTYLVDQLPPTPIALVSLSSLQAALHPARSDYYYYVAKGDGSHVFSKTLEEQNRAVNLYIRANKNTDKPARL